MMFTVFAIADEILKIAKRKEISLTPMQLMKLVYIAHGWSLAILKHDIFHERIEAWKYGPVIPALYQGTKKYGRDPIPLNLIDENAPSNFSDEIQFFLEEIFEKYGHMSGIQLSNLTHMYGTPWQKVYQPNATGLEIPDEMIRQHYKEKLDEYRQQRSATTTQQTTEVVR